MRARRLAVIDEYLEGDEAVVFVGGQVVALSPLATTALLAIGPEWTDVSTVAAALVATYGAPPEDSDPLAATHTTLQSLAQLAIIELS